MESKRLRVFTQEDAAEYFGVSPRTYQGWERVTNPHEPVAFVKSAVLKKIARAYRGRKKGMRDENRGMKGHKAAVVVEYV